MSGEAVTPPVDAQAALNALTPEARASWELTGEWPSETPAAPVTEPEADEPDDPEPAAEPTIDAKPAAPTPEKPISKRQQHINDLIRQGTEAGLRAAEAEKRAEKLEARIAEIERARTEPAKPVEPVPVVDPNDPEPVEESFDTYREFVKAQAKWEVRQARREEKAEREAADAETKQRQAYDARITRFASWIERRDAFAAAEPQFADKARAFLDQVTEGTPLGDTLLDSPVGPQVAWHLVNHPEDRDRIARLGPIQQLRALGKLEALYDSDSPRTSASAGPAAKTVTSAPAPPTLLNARSTDPADPVRSAVARGDFRAFEAEENRKALTSR